jgi:hypothetical protein
VSVRAKHRLGKLHREERPEHDGTHAMGYSHGKVSARKHQAIERDDCTFYFFAQDAATQIVEVLQDKHRHVEMQGANKQLPNAYMTLTAMIERAGWVTEVGSVRKSLPRRALDEKNRKVILDDFPISFKTEYNGGSAALVSRPMSLKTDKQRRYPRVPLRNCVRICLELLQRIRYGSMPRKQ